MSNTDLNAKLTLTAETQGGEQLQEMGRQLGQLSQDAGASAPQLKKMADELQALGQQQGLIDSFRAAKSASAELQRQLNTAAAEVERLAATQQQAASAAAQAAQAQADSAARLAAARQEQAAYKEAVAAASAELARLREAARGAMPGELGAQIKQQAASLAELRERASQAGLQVRQLASEQRESAAAQKQATTAQQQATREYDRQVSATGKISAALGQQNRALAEAREGMAAAGLSAKNLQQAQAGINQQLEAAKARLQDAAKLYIQTGSAAQQAGQQAAGAFDQAGQGVAGLHDKLGQVTQAMAGLFALSKVKAFAGDAIATADAFGEMAKRVEMASDSAEEYNLVQERLLRTANETYRPLAEQQEMYIRTAAALRDMGKSTEEVLDITDSLSYLLTTNSASAERAEAAINAYTKAIQTGKIDSMAWQSLLAATPTLVEAIAQSTGMAAEQVRQLGITGKLAVEDLNKGLQQTVEQNRAAVEGMATTVGDAMTRLSNTWGEFLRGANESSGATQKLVGLIEMLTENLDTLVSVAMTAGQVLAAMAGARALTAMRAYVLELGRAGGATVALTAQTNALGAAVARAQVAMRGLAAAGKSLAYAALIMEVTELTINLARLYRQSQQLRQAQGDLADTSERVRKRLAEVSATTGVTVTSMDELDAAVQQGRLHFDEASASWQAGTRAQKDLAEQTRLTTQELVNQRIDALLADFDDLVAATGDAVKALDELSKALDVDSSESVAAFSAALGELARTGRASAEEVQAAWAKVLQRLDAHDFAQLRANFAQAVAEGVAGAREWAQVNELALAESFRRLGLDADVALQRISDKTTEAMGAIDLMAESLKATGASAEQMGRSMELAAQAAIATAKTLPDIEALERKMQELAEAGLLSADAAARLTEQIERQREAVEKGAPGLQKRVDLLKAAEVAQKAEADAVMRSLQAQMQMARQSEQMARLQGDEVAAREAKIRQIEIEIEITKAQIKALQAEAEASIKMQEAKREELAARGELTAVAEAEIEAAIKSAKAKGEEVKALEHLIKTLQETKRAEEDRGRASKEAGDKAKEGGQKAAEGAEEAEAAHKKAGEVIRGTWLSAKAAASDYAEAAKQYAWDIYQEELKLLPGIIGFSTDSWKARQNLIVRMRENADAYIEAMERIDDAQRRLEATHSGAADGVEALRMRLLELNGTEEQVAAARTERDKAQVERTLAALALDLQRAELAKDSAETDRLRAEMALYREQLALIEQISRAEAKQRKEREREAKERSSGGGGGSSSGGTPPPSAPGGSGVGGTGGGVGGGTVNITLNANGVNDPARLARMIEPELRKLAQLAR